MGDSFLVLISMRNVTDLIWLFLSIYIIYLFCCNVG